MEVRSPASAALATARGAILGFRCGTLGGHDNKIRAMQPTDRGMGDSVQTTAMTRPTTWYYSDP